MSKYTVTFVRNARNAGNCRDIHITASSVDAAVDHFRKMTGGNYRVICAMPADA